MYTKSCGKMEIGTGAIGAMYQVPQASQLPGAAGAKVGGARYHSGSATWGCRTSAGRIVPMPSDGRGSDQGDR